MGIAADLTANFYGGLLSVASFEGFRKGDRFFRGPVQRTNFYTTSRISAPVVLSIKRRALPTLQAEFLRQSS